jgi:hypothetical protein
MNYVLDYVGLASSIWMLFFISTIKTHNLKSHIVYKFIPLILSFMLLLPYAAKALSHN